MKTLLPSLVGVSLAVASAAGNAQDVDKDLLELSVDSISLTDALNDGAQQAGYQTAIRVAGLSRNEPERIRVAADDRSALQDDQASRNERHARDMGSLEEIVVTAQKRLQRLQDVPISISVVNGEDITQRGLVSAEDYLRGIPGVNQGSAITGSTVV